MPLPGSSPAGAAFAPHVAAAIAAGRGRAGGPGPGPPAQARVPAPPRPLAPHVAAALAGLQAKPSPTERLLAPHVAKAIGAIQACRPPAPPRPPLPPRGVLQRASSSDSGGGGGTSGGAWNYLNIGAGQNPFPPNMFGGNLPRPLNILNVDPTYTEREGNRIPGSVETLGEIVGGNSQDTVFSISPFGYDPLDANIIGVVKVGGWIFVAGNGRNPFFSRKKPGKPNRAEAPPPGLRLIAYEEPGVNVGAIPGLLKSALRSQTTHGGHAVGLTHFALYEKEA